MVGLTEAQAQAQFRKVDIYQTMFRPLKSTLSGRDNAVLLKLVVDGASDRVLGCHIVGPDAGEMIQLARHRGEDGRHQGRLRRHHGGASDHRGRARHHAHGDQEPRREA